MSVREYSGGVSPFQLLHSILFCPNPDEIRSLHNKNKMLLEPVYFKFFFDRSPNPHHTRNKNKNKKSTQETKLSRGNILLEGSQESVLLLFGLVLSVTELG
jgi:hypothetical protein